MSSSTRGAASATSRRKAPNLSPYAQVSPPPAPPTYPSLNRTAPSGRGAPTRTHVAVSGPPSSLGTHSPGVCYCPQCIAADKRRQTGLWHAPSPYLEDLTKSLVVSQPARRKLQLVPPRRYPVAVSPYETLREANRVSARAQLRAQLQVNPAVTRLGRAALPNPNHALRSVFQ
jgi:hypothetical protein